MSHFNFQCKCINLYTPDDAMATLVHGGGNSTVENVGSVDICVVIKGFELEIVSRILSISTASLSAKGRDTYY